MIARCARCQGTFTTDRFGAQSCPHCGTTLDLADPGAQAARPPPPPAAGGPWSGQAAPPPGAPPPQAGVVPPSPGAPPPAGAVPPPVPPPIVPPASGLPPGGPPPIHGQPPGGPPPYGLPPGAPPPPPGAWGPPPGWTPPPPSYPELPAPFAERTARGFLPSLVETAKLVALQPTDFFRRVRVDQPGSAVLFGVFLGSLGTIAGALYGWALGSSLTSALQGLTAGMPDASSEVLGSLGTAMSGFVTLGQVISAPIVALVGIYLSAGLIHLALLLLRGTPRRFDATLTVVGYAYGLFGLGVLPVCGGMVATVWYLAVVIIGLGEAQRCGPGKAAVAVFAPVILLCLCCCTALVAGGAGSLSAIQELLRSAKDQGTSL